MYFKSGTGCDHKAYGIILEVLKRWFHISVTNTLKKFNS